MFTSRFGSLPSLATLASRSTLRAVPFAITISSRSDSIVGSVAIPVPIAIAVSGVPFASSISIRDNTAQLRWQRHLHGRQRVQMTLSAAFAATESPRLPAFYGSTAFHVYNHSSTVNLFSVGFFIGRFWSHITDLGCC